MNELKIFEVEKQVISSREIAIVTGKNHGHVMHDIREMCIQGEIEVLSNVITFNSDSQEVIVIESEIDIEFGHQGHTRKSKEYLLNDMAAQVLALGYDVKRRIAILKLVKEMKVALEKQAVTLNSAKPILVLSNGTRTIAEVAKLLNENKTGTDKISSHKINQVLRLNGYFKPNKQPYQKWINQGLFAIEQYNLNYYSAKRITVTDNKGLPMIQQLFGQKNQLSPVVIKNNNQTIEPTYNNQTFLLEKINEGRLSRLEETMLTFINHMLASKNGISSQIEVENYRTKLKIFKTEVEKQNSNHKSIELI